MYKEINLGERVLKLEANAATPYRYKQVFSEDLLPFFSGKRNDEDATMMVPKLAFIMAMQAEGTTEWGKTTTESFLKWAESFEGLDLIRGDVAGEVLSAYTSSYKNYSTPKKSKG